MKCSFILSFLLLLNQFEPVWQLCMVRHAFKDYYLTHLVHLLPSSGVVLPRSLVRTVQYSLYSLLFICNLSRLVIIFNSVIKFFKVFFLSLWRNYVACLRTKSKLFRNNNTRISVQTCVPCTCNSKFKYNISN